jgi:ATP-binding cassette subfamily B protein RaxB
MAVGEAFLNLTGLRRLPLLRQAEAAECGLACIGMIAGYHGHRTDLASLRREYPVSTRGSTLKDLVEISSSIGLGSRAIRCEPDELPQLRLPAILHWEMQHFVVLASATKQRIVVHDPARGRRSYKTDEVSKSFTGVALELTPTALFRRKRLTRPVQLASLVRLDPMTWQALGQALLLSVVLQLFVLLGPYYVQLVIDEAIQKSDKGLLLALAGAFALLKLFEVAATALRSLVFQFLSNVLTFDMKASLFHHMVRLPISYFQRRSIGDIQQRFQSLQPISDFVAGGAVAALVDGLLALSICALLFVYNLGLALVTLGGLAVYAAIKFAFVGLSQRLAGDRLVAQARESSKFLETLRAMQTIKVAGAESEREGLWRNWAADFVNAGIRLGNGTIGYSALNQSILGFTTILVVFVAAQSAIEGKMTVGMISAFLAYKAQLEQRLTAFIDQFISWKLLDVHLDRIADIAISPREPGIDAPQLDRVLGGQIDLVDVGFRYGPNEADVFRNVSMTIAAGEFVAIAGPSGGGKSTLLRLLVGLHPPTTGQVLYDSIPAGTWGPKAIRHQVGIVLQDDTLLSGTIAENIAMFDERIDMDLVKKVAEIACVDDDIERLPMGYRSLVGDMGSSLSGGQQQRIILARALYRSPKVLIMDEGTAHLDVGLERRINERLRQLKITRIVAAHRPDTIAIADRRYVLMQGSLRKLDAVPSQQIIGPEREVPQRRA